MLDVYNKWKLPENNIMGVIKKDVENMIAKKISTMKNTAFVKTKIKSSLLN